VSQNVTARLLTEGTFLHPTDNVTFYTRLIGTDGVLRDVFLSDRRNPQEGVIYTASEAYLVRNGAGTTLIMVDGLAQRLSTADTRLATAKFADFSFDISALVNRVEARKLSPANMVTPALWDDWPTIATETNSTTGDIAEEFHSRFAQALFCVIAALVGYATLMVGGFSRFGVWREIAIAFGLLIAIDGLRGALVDAVRSDAAVWPLMYLPSLIGTVLVLGLLSFASRPQFLRRWKRRAA